VTRRAAVLGSPIHHSRSPLLHQTAYRELGLDWDYTAVDVQPAQLADFIATLDADWVGLSLTMPLKVEVLPHLDDISEVASAAQAVNTVTFRDGRRLGDNTDVPALTRFLKDAGETATILGAGATARSAVVALHQRGVPSVICWARRLDAARDLAMFAHSLGIEAEARAGEPEPDLLEASVVISALPGDAAKPWAALVHAPLGLLIDVSYDPWPPPLTQAWPQGRRITGLDVLLEQAALQIEYWSGQSAPRDSMRAALLSTMAGDPLD